MSSHHSLYGLRVILIVSVCFYTDVNCFGLVRVVSSSLRVGSVAAGSFGWVVADGFRWFRMVSGVFGWFTVLVVTRQKVLQLFSLKLVSEFKEYSFFVFLFILYCLVLRLGNVLSMIASNSRASYFMQLQYLF